MHIKWEPAIHFNEAAHVLSGLTWKFGEVKDVDPDWFVRIRVDGVPINVSIVEDLLSSPDYVALPDESPLDANPSAD